MDIIDLKRKTVAELQTVAEDLHIDNVSGLRKQDLIFRIERHLLGAAVELHAEGVLEILDEGYGFLRSQDWSYLAGPDDVYVSPSQIKRFDLRTGDTIVGQVRPPKDWERYLALLRVDSINGDPPVVGTPGRSLTTCVRATPTSASIWRPRAAISACGWSTSSRRSAKDSAV